jgi:hypothetical protein
MLIIVIENRLIMVPRMATLFVCFGFFFLAILVTRKHIITVTVFKKFFYMRVPNMDHIKCLLTA